MNETSYYVMTMPGLETVAFSEIQARITGAQLVKFARGIAVFQAATTLRDLLARYVPAETIPASKRGFAVPLGDWLSGPLRPLVEDNLLRGGTYPGGVFADGALRTYCDDHFSGKADHKWGIWTLLMLQLWAEYNSVQV